MRMNKGSFTLIELIVTMMLMAIIMVPMAFLSMEFMHAIPYMRDLGVVRSLARMELAKVNNLSFADVADYSAANYSGYPYTIVRTVGIVPGSNNNLKRVQVQVFKDGSVSNPLVSLTTYSGNNAAAAGTFVFGRGAEPLCGLTQAKALVVSGGSLSGKNLTGVVIKNVCSSAVTITGIKITFTRSGGGVTTLKSVNFNGSAAEWSGSASSPANVTLTTPFTLSANTSYSNTNFLTFNDNVTNPGGIVSLAFIMNDAGTKSQTVSYSW